MNALELSQHIAARLEEDGQNRRNPAAPIGPQRNLAARKQWKGLQCVDNT
jgi:hypothetical protein